MESCPYCKRAMVLLEKDIGKGVVVVKSHTQAPSGVRGFPYFVSGSNTYTGFPKSKTALFQELGVNTESYKDLSCGTSWPDRDCTLNTYGWWKAGVL